MKIRGRLGQSLLIVLSLVVALTTLLMVGCSSKQATTGQQTMVKLGLSLALTGPMASGSAPMSQGMLAYTKYVNDQGGIQYVDPATGKTEKALLDVHWQDNAYDAAQRLSVYKTQKDWGMVLQLLVSSPDDVAGVASTSAVPIMSVASIDATSLAPQPVYVTGLFVPYPAQNAAFIKWASQQQATPPRIALLALDQPIFRNQFSGKGLTPEFVSQYGGVLADVEYVSPTSTDYTIELTRIKAANPDWIITQLVPSEIALAVTDALRIGMPNTVKFVGTSSTYDESIVGLLGNESNGIYGMTAWAFPTQTSIAGVQLAKQIMMKYYNTDADTDSMQGIAAAMIAVEGIHQALNKVGPANLTPSAVNDALHSLTNFDPMGLFPTVNMTAAYPAASQSIHVGVIQGGVVNALTGWLPCPVVPGQ